MSRRTNTVTRWSGPRALGRILRSGTVGLLGFDMTARRGLRAAVASFLDSEYLRMTRARIVPASLLTQIYAFEVVMPPPRLLLSGNQSLNGLLFLVSLARALAVR